MLVQIPIIMLVVEVPCDLVCSIQSPKDGPDCITVDQDSNGNTEMVGFEDSAAANSLPTNTGNLANAKSVRLDISFKTPSHTGLQTTQLVFIFFCFSIARFFFLHYTLFICMYLCNLFLSFGRVFLKKFLLQVKDLTDQFPAATPLALVLKQFLADRTLDQSYSGGLSSYCLVRRILLLK